MNGLGLIVCFCVIILLFNQKSFRRSFQLFLCFSLLFLGGCSSKSASNTIEKDITKVTTDNTLEVVNIYEAIKESYPKTTLLKGTKSDSYHWWNQRHVLDVNGTTLYIDEYESSDDAKMYTELVHEYNDLDEYVINDIGVTKEYITNEGINLDDFKIKSYQRSNFVIVFPNDISTKMESEIVTCLENLNNVKSEMTYSSIEYLSLLDSRKETFLKGNHSSLDAIFASKDEEYTNYINDTLTKYQDTTVTADNYLTLKKEVESTQDSIQLVSSTSRYTEMYQPLVTRLLDLDAQCNQMISNNSNDLEAKIQSLETTMNYDLLNEVGTIYAVYANEEAYSDKTSDWKTRIDTLNSQAEQQKAAEEEQRKAEEERAAQEAAELSAQQQAQQQAQATQQTEQTHDYIINKNTKKFHYSNCKSVKQMKEKNKWYYNGTRQSVLDMGYSSCQNCNP